MGEREIIQYLELIGIYKEEQLKKEDINYWWQLKYKENKNDVDFLYLINSIKNKLEDYEIQDLISIIRNARNYQNINNNNQESQIDESDQIEMELLNIIKNAEDAEKCNNFEEAINFYDQAINLRPKSITYHFDRARCKYEVDDYTGAIIDCTFEINLNDHKNGEKIISKAYAVRGISKYYLDDYQEAIVDLNYRILTEPSDAVAYYYRGNCYNLLEKDEESIHDFDKAIELNPENYQSYYFRGLSKMNLGDFQGAIIDLNKLKEIDKDPQSVVFRVLGVCEFELENYENALENFQKAIEKDEDDEYSKGKYMECLNILEN